MKYALIGRYDYNNPFDDFERLEIRQEISHPKYNDDTKEYDIMVLQLMGSSDGYHELKLNFDESIPDVADSTIQIIGLGRTDASQYSPPNVLQKVQLSYMPNEDCEDSNFGGVSYQKRISNDMMCMQSVETGQCHGDSGGPALLIKDGTRLQVGIISW